MIPSAWLGLAARRNARQIERTPLTCAPELDPTRKLNNWQVTGSFGICGDLCAVVLFACPAAILISGEARG